MFGLLGILAALTLLEKLLELNQVKSKILILVIVCFNSALAWWDGFFYNWFAVGVQMLKLLN